MGVDQVMADPKEMIDSLNKQISELKSQVKSAALEMEMMRARMNDLSQDAKQAVQIERFVIPDDDRLGEINDLVDLMDKAIKTAVPTGHRQKRQGALTAPRPVRSMNGSS